MQVSHALNPPLFGRFELGCSGACNCTCLHSEHQPSVNCSWDTLTKGRATVTQFFRLLVQEREQWGEAAPCQPDQCKIEIRNAREGAAPVPPATAVGFRVVTRALIVGVSDYRMRWLNTYHLDNSGIRNVRRVRS